MPCSASLPTIVSGACPSSVVTSAPIRRSGSAMRSIGRVRSESSPVRTKRPCWPASTPASRRIKVPAFAQSTGASGSAQAAQAETVHDQLVVAELLDLDAERAHRVHRRHRVLRAAEALNVRLALADAAEHDRAVRDRLVAGHGDVTDDRDGRIDLHLTLSRSCVP